MVSLVTNFSMAPRRIFGSRQGLPRVCVDLSSLQAFGQQRRFAQHVPFCNTLRSLQISSGLPDHTRSSIATTTFTLPRQDDHRKPELKPTRQPAWSAVSDSIFTASPLDRASLLVNQVLETTTVDNTFLHRRPSTTSQASVQPGVSQQIDIPIDIIFNPTHSLPRQPSTMQFTTTVLALMAAVASAQNTVTTTASTTYTLTRTVERVVSTEYITGVSGQVSATGTLTTSVTMPAWVRNGTMMATGTGASSGSMPSQTGMPIMPANGAAKYGMEAAAAGVVAVVAGLML